MAEKATNPKETVDTETSAYKDYVFIELGFSVKARTLKEAESKAEQKVKEK